MRILDYDVLNYEEAITLQEEIRENLSIREEDNTVLLLEHPPTITTGLQINKENIFASDEELRQKGVRLATTNRGGDVTYHGPGQLIIYPILNLKDMNLTIVSYIEMLEQTINTTLKQFNIIGHTKPKFKGVWVSEKKISSIGINIKRRITTHGAALNVNTDLSYFSLINACGLNTRMTSMKDLLGHSVDLAHVKRTWISEFEVYTKTIIEYVRK